MTPGTPLMRFGIGGTTPAGRKKKAGLLSPSETPREREQLEYRYSEQ
jgi:hypothetical protein